MSLRLSVASAAIAMVVGSASAGIGSYAPGSVVFTETQGDFIGVIDVGAGLPNFSVLHNFVGGPAAGVNPANLTLAGDGNWYVSQGTFDVSAPARIIRVQNLFGSPVESNFYVGEQTNPGSPMDNPIGINWDSARQRLWVVDNPGLSPTGGIDNVLCMTLGAAVQTSYSEPPDILGAPIYQDGTRMTPDRNSGNYFMIAPNGGLTGQGGLATGNPGVIWRMTVDGSNNMTASVFFDFSDYLPTLVGEPAGITSAMNPDGSADLFVPDYVSNAIYRVGVNADGSVGTVSQILTGLSGAGEIQYDPYNNKIVFANEGTSQIFRMNRDGSGLEVLANNVRSRGIYIIPTPGAATIAGLAGLVALRRRRN